MRRPIILLALVVLATSCGTRSDRVTTPPSILTPPESVRRAVA
ncbi:MAG TPA: hypothetical protein VJA44_01525 [Acidimicrobiia bacterium]|nr:hypothetical protein [Acidimicrobiia bacterium]HLE38320.1 hypothetical protein [Acidimicrobiia bacterium]